MGVEEDNSLGFFKANLPFFKDPFRTATIGCPFSSADISSPYIGQVCEPPTKGSPPRKEVSPDREVLMKGRWR
jgi:hypothetical protein|tara:strand:+ start:348 stop:566 length:219 start_codon:yes stop_codon:yes gene_type:complete